MNQSNSVRLICSRKIRYEQCARIEQNKDKRTLNFIITFLKLNKNGRLPRTL